MTAGQALLIVAALAVLCLATLLILAALDHRDERRYERHLQERIEASLRDDSPPPYRVIGGGRRGPGAL